MQKFSFYQDRKVTYWERAHFNVIAATYEEAISIIQSWKGEDVINYEDDKQVIFTNGEILYDTSENLSVEDNEGQATIEVFTSNGEEISNNIPNPKRAK